jgi:hypothetical protein
VGVTGPMKRTDKGELSVAAQDLQVCSLTLAQVLCETPSQRCLVTPDLHHVRTLLHILFKVILKAYFPVFLFALMIVHLCCLFCIGSKSSFSPAADVTWHADLD